MNRYGLAIACSFLTLSFSAMAFQNNISQLEGATIIKAGNISDVKCPPYGKYDCLSWPRNLYEIEGRNTCIIANIGFGCGIGCTGFLSTKNGQLSLYTISNSTLNLKTTLDETSAELVECPSRY